MSRPALTRLLIEAVLHGNTADARFLARKLKAMDAPRLWTPTGYVPAPVREGRS